MKKKIVLLLGAIAAILLIWSAIAGQRQQSYVEAELRYQDKIWIITDLHYLSQDLFDDGEAFSYIEKTAAGKDLRYGKERMEALVEQVEREHPSLLLVSGDLTLNGEKQSMVELSQYFTQIEEKGTEVLVIPGNHDIASGWARAFKGDQQVVTDQVTAQQFSDIFDDHGYQQASSRDQASLSYLAKPFSNAWFLMIDSNIYSDGYGKGAPPTNGRIKKETLDWIEVQLQAAKEAGVNLIPVVHHNVLQQHAMLSKGYTLDNAADLKALFNQYGIQFGFSGHTHSQNIVEEDLGQVSYSEVVNGAFSIYPAIIGQLSLGNASIHYQKTQLDMAWWTEKHQPSDPNLQDHVKYLQTIFDNTSDIMVHNVLNDERWYDGETADAISQFIMPANRAYFSGEKLDQTWLEEMVFPSQAYQTLQAVSPRSFLADYLDVIIKRSQGRDVEKLGIKTEKDFVQ
ncbi:TPA: metallophosphoesterase [Streptococcus suis]|uniref:metallophosphoesterase n=1 Tax=Streptococcus TaxID=1301 RepID=UPI001960C395|nr:MULTISPECIES: metallophosphoesterase [Streptococcus]MBM7136167.1 metallophosphoesterase [Streptococcus suis]MBY0731179.1 metallophosphoesterase [Streptococcus sp. 2018162]MCO8177171.1 metallophosphoesterase [Streptococcus suis]HEM3463801.1 metallophosphoesterase [Streptococcus suis]